MSFKHKREPQQPIRIKDRYQIGVYQLQYQHLPQHLHYHHLDEDLHHSIRQDARGSEHTFDEVQRALDRQGTLNRP